MSCRPSSSPAPIAGTLRYYRAVRGRYAASPEVAIGRPDRRPDGRCLRARDRHRFERVDRFGDGRENSASVLECIALIEEIGGYPIDYSLKPQNRKGDHVCCISDLTKLRSHYPEWAIRVSLREMLSEMIAAEEQKGSATL